MDGVEKSRVFPFRPEYLEMDPETYGSTAEEKVEEEWRQPRSMAKVVVEKKGSIEVHAHSQILRIRAEDSNLGEDYIGEGNMRLKDRIDVTHFMLFSRPILPASPLSGKTSC